MKAQSNPAFEQIEKKVEVPKKQQNNASKFVIVESFLKSKFEFRYDEVANEIEYREKGVDKFRPVNENDIYRVLQHQNIPFSMSNLLVILRSNFVSKYNPFETYFNGLQVWDEETDHILHLCTFIKAKKQETFNKHFKKMLVRCVACSLGLAFNKQAFIFIGGQNGGKTTFCRWLCPEILEQYYTENISTDKDSLISLSENFIVNMDELASLQKAELDLLKSLISKDAIKVRRPYDRKPSIAKRRANFFGSTNKEEFLTDETGSVRWLCFELDEIVWDYKERIDCNQIWAQAYSLLKKGFKYELTAEEIAENENSNVSHQLRTIELELIQSHFEESEKGKPFAEAYTATDVLNKLKNSGIYQSQLSLRSIGKALKLLGFKQINERMGENKMPKKVYWLKFIQKESALGFIQAEPTT